MLTIIIITLTLANHLSPKTTYPKKTSQDQYIITIYLTFEILNFLQKKKCIYISKNQFILGDVLSLTLSLFRKVS